MRVQWVGCLHDDSGKKDCSSLRDPTWECNEREKCLHDAGLFEAAIAVFGANQ